MAHYTESVGRTIVQTVLDQVTVLDLQLGPNGDLGQYIQNVKIKTISNFETSEFLNSKYHASRVEFKLVVKGQLISKILFGVSILPKTEPKKKST